ncbi:polyprenyl synthetase family protein [Lipingzhangella sp. LS1_29]|uniref:Polyprenyl synthetase family protein n=1 Tax=Lipingzhangella rawalii TaxID=2055835 RepID=A0ABU2H1H7_9ACTN|nr:polyprenyl synthetase family protein [Lipingzhangella rawalii]MDS1269153.1 polyprenyl synthetase family protein [Lipingzhangella rawalii]
MAVTHSSRSAIAQIHERARIRDLVEPELRAAVESLPSGVRRVAGYHFGWWDAAGVAQEGGSGKAVRPLLTMLAAEGVHGDVRSAVPAAVAVELVHNFSLLHDDVLDADETRRHRPTAWTVFGTDAAILAGDALLSLALDVAMSGHGAASTACARTLSAAVQELIAGQVADLSLERRVQVESAESQEMAQQKTGTLLGCAGAMGALAAGASGERVAALRSFGVCVGMAFQHVDDLLGIWGDPQVTGKPIYADLRRRKKSLPVVAALTSGTTPGDELARMYSQPEPLRDGQLPRAAWLVEEAGGRQWSQEQARLLRERAVGLVEDVVPVHAAARDLRALAVALTSRSC